MDKLSLIPYEAKQYLVEFMDVYVYKSLMKIGNLHWGKIIDKKYS